MTILASQLADLRNLYKQQPWQVFGPILIIVALCVLWLIPIPSQRSWYLLQGGLAVVAFILPGAAAALLLFQEARPLTLITVGFGCSIAGLGLLTTLARLLHWPYETLRITFFLCGILLLLVLFEQIVHRKVQLHGESIRRDHFIQALGFIILTLIAIGLMRKPGFDLDSITYMAYSQRWQFARQLNFNQLIIATGNVDSFRWWLATFPVAIGLMGDLANIPIIVFYSPVFHALMTVMALAALWYLCSELELSSWETFAAVLLQLLFLLLLMNTRQPGDMFSRRLVEDKLITAFILAPTLFGVAARYLKRPHWRSLVGFGILALALVFTHSTVTAMAFIVVMAFVGLRSIIRQQWKQFGALLVVLVTVSIPLIVIELTAAKITLVVNEEAMSNEIRARKLDSRLIFAGANNQFYGIAPSFYLMDTPTISIGPIEHLLNGPLGVLLRSFPVAMMLCTILISILRIKYDLVASFLIAANLFVLAAMIPYTGWLIGLAITPAQLWRTTWFIPFGLNATYLLMNGLHIIDTYPGWKVSAKAGVVALSLATCLWRLMAIGIMPQFSELQSRYDVAQIGQLVDELDQTNPMVIGASDALNNFVPSASHNATILYYRQEQELISHNVPLAEAAERTSDYRHMVAGSTSTARRLSLFNKWRVDYIIAQPGIEWLEKFQAECESCLSIIGQSGKVVLLRVNHEATGN